MSIRPFDELRFTHGSAWQLRIEAAGLTDTLNNVGEGYYEAWDTDQRGAVLAELERTQHAIARLRKQLTAPVEESLQGACEAPMTHEDGTTVPCTLIALHNRFEIPHQDEHGHQAKQLVSWSTIEEVRRVQEARERGEIT